MEEEMPVNVAISTPPSKTSGLPDSLMFASLDLSPEKRTILLFTGATPINSLVYHHIHKANKSETKGAIKRTFIIINWSAISTRFYLLFCYKCIAILNKFSASMLYVMWALPVKHPEMANPSIVVLLS